ncbi:girdin-like [Chironomus tepperi]|uniref:girdin-like n=1 Tax=Chironomus tepperi TaxID=113505 RepID=UPI00391F4051
MIKNFCVFLCILMTCCGSLWSTTIECKFNFIYVHRVGSSVYRCLVQNDPNITTKESAQITSVVGIHNNSKVNDDVIAFDVEEKTINFFPQGLEVFFKNLKAIHIYRSGLKEIHKNDLKPFPKLVNFYVTRNVIEVIEEGLFDYNLELEVIGIHESKIIHIDPNVLDHLDKLNTCAFYETPCVKQNVQDSKERVKKFIQIVKKNCANIEFLNLNTQFKKLENDSKTLSLDLFGAKLSNFEEALKKSKFSNHSSFLERIETFKMSKSVQKPKSETNLTLLTSSVPSIDENETNISQNCSNCCQMDLVLKTISNLTNLYNNLKIPQNEIEKSLKNLKGSIEKLELLTSKNGSSDETYSIFDEKFDNIEETLSNSLSKNTRKLEEVQKEIEISRYRTLVSIDAKIKLIEQRVIDKVEKIMNEKLGKIMKALNIES